MVTRARKARIFLLGRGSARHALRSAVTAVCGYGKEKSRSRMAAGSRNGADDGSRTHLIGLGSRSSTDELHPQIFSFCIIAPIAGNFNKNFSTRFGKIISQAGIFLSRPGKWRVTAARGGSPPAALTPRRNIRRHRRRRAGFSPAR